MECGHVIFVWSHRGVTSDTVLNAIRGIRDEKYKNAEITDNNRVSRAETEAADIAKQMTLGKATMDKLKAIDENNKIVEDVGNITKPSMAEMLVMYRNTFRVQTAKDNFRLGCIDELNASGVLKNGAVVLPHSG